MGLVDIIRKTTRYVALLGSLYAANGCTITIELGSRAYTIGSKPRQRIVFASPVDPLLSLVNREGERAFSLWESESFKRSGGTVEYARQLLALKDDRGRSFFARGRDIKEYKEVGGTVEEAASFASLKNRQGKSMVISGSSLVSYKKSGGTLSYAIAFAKETNADWLSLGMFMKVGIGTNDVNRLASLVYPNTKKRVFPSMYEVGSYVFFGGTVDYAASLAQRRFSYIAMHRFVSLGLPLENVTSFKDTKKPNAVILYGQYGHRTFDMQNELFKSLLTSYDTWIRVIKHEKEICESINTIPNAELLIFAAHGTPDSIILYGESGKGKQKEEFTIDLSDRLDLTCLQKLHSNAVVFLDSCSTGKGGTSGKNMANFIASIANGRRVIAAKNDFHPHSVHLRSSYPFDAIIRYKEFTYTTRR